MPPPVFNYYYDFWDRNSTLERDELLKAFMDEMGTLFDADYQRDANDIPTQGKLHGLDRLGSSKAEKLYVDRARFIERVSTHLDGYPRPTRKHFFQVVHVAYAEALNREIASKNPWIVYQLHWPDVNRTRKVVSDFAGAYFVHMVREPAPSLAALYNGLALGRGFDSMTYGARCIAAILQGAGPVLPEIRESSRVIRLEDIHAKAEDIMRKLSAWMNISWSGNLLESTFNGKLWWSIPSRKGDLSGFDTKRLSDVSAQRHVMSSLDTYVIKSLLYDRYVAWGYVKPSRLMSLIRWLTVLPLLLFPFRMEIHAIRNAKKSDHVTVVLGSIVRLHVLAFSVWLRRGFLPIKSAYNKIRWVLKAVTVGVEGASPLL